MDFEDLAPEFHAALARAAANLTREGHALPAEAATVFTAKEGPVGLAITVGSRGVVAHARHTGARSATARAVLDVFCGVVEGLPMQEAADHGGIKTVYRLLGGARPRGVLGILTVETAGPAFALPERLFRSAHAEWRAATGTTATQNFYQARVSQAWSEATDAARRERLAPLVSAFLAREGLAPEAVALETIEQEVRLVLLLDGSVEPARKPALLRGLERHLRAATGERLEVLVSEMQDQNRLRRLTTTG